ncbi:MAG: hypothetical protein WC414_00980 [Patescibacteria group bacterium]
MKNNKLWLWSLAGSAGTIIYIMLVVWFMGQAEHGLFEGQSFFLAPVMMLTLFVFSALVTGSLILGKPIMLYVDNEKKTAIKMLVTTVLMLFIEFMIMLIIAGFLI